jgi:hypothetical protein
MEILSTPSFFFHEQEDLRKGIDTEGRVLEFLECGIIGYYGKPSPASRTKVL